MQLSREAPDTGQEPDRLRSALGTSYLAPRDELELHLSRIWQKVLDVPSVGVTDSYFDLVAARHKDYRVVDHASLGALNLVTEIAHDLGRELPAAVLFEATTIEHMADLLRQESPSLPWSPLVRIQPRGSRPPFFGVHGRGAHVTFYHYLAKHLGQDQPFYGLQSRGLDGKQSPFSRVEDMAAHYIEQMRSVQPEGPYFLGGKSGGGIVVFEMAQQLRARGAEVGLLVMFDTIQPNLVVRRPGERLQSVRGSRLRTLSARVRAKFQKLPARARQVRARMRRRRRLRAEPETFTLGLGRPLPPAVRAVSTVNRRACLEYIPSVYPGSMTLLRCQTQPSAYEQVKDLGWSALVAGDLEVLEVPGTHESMFFEPHVGALGETLSTCLEQATAAAVK